MLKIEEYIQLSLVDRQAHLRLDESCSEIGGDSREFRGLLSYFVGCTIPSGIRNIHLCHACNNAKCSNVRHLYWGTSKENCADTIKAGRHVGTLGKKLKYPKRKYSARPKQQLSENRWLEICAVLESTPRNYGWVQQAANKLNVSHTQVRRYEQKRLQTIKETKCSLLL